MEVNQLPLDKTEIVNSANWIASTEAANIPNLILVEHILRVFRTLKQLNVYYIDLLRGKLIDEEFERRPISLDKKNNPPCRIEISVELKKLIIWHLRTEVFWLKFATLVPQHMLGKRAPEVTIHAITN